MSRRKQPTNETPEQIFIRQKLEVISNIATRNERISWDRKMENMIKLLAKIQPIEAKITELILEKQVFFDEVSILRAEMVKDCVHPVDNLVYNTDDTLGEYIECKFCNKRFTIVGTDNGPRV